MPMHMARCPYFHLKGPNTNQIVLDQEVSPNIRSNTAIKAFRSSGTNACTPINLHGIEGAIYTLQPHFIRLERIPASMQLALSSVEGRT
mmetsp:Transcript_7163/g.15370  ORF Transcript_7163/g.15370 Transcript_7163/m.15370 type:complete len:89 (+) Transcript_7163:307-573(+)